MEMMMTFNMTPGTAAWMLMVRWHDPRPNRLIVLPDMRGGSTYHGLMVALNAQSDAEREARERAQDEEMRRGNLRFAWMTRHLYADDTLLDEPEDRCTNPTGHEWSYTGTAYGGDDERWHGEGRCLCIHCGADGDA